MRISRAVWPLPSIALLRFLAIDVHAPMIEIVGAVRLAGVREPAFIAVEDAMQARRLAPGDMSVAQAEMPPRFGDGSVGAHHQVNRGCQAGAVVAVGAMDENGFRRVSHRADEGV